MLNHRACGTRPAPESGRRLSPSTHSGSLAGKNSLTILRRSMLGRSRDHPNSPVRVPPSPLNLLDFTFEVGIKRSANQYPFSFLHDFGSIARRLAQHFTPIDLFNPLLSSNQWESANSATNDASVKWYRRGLVVGGTGRHSMPTASLFREILLNRGLRLTTSSSAAFA